MTDYPNITAACTDYDQAAQRYNDCAQEEQRALDAVKKRFGQPLNELSTQLEAALYTKHELIGKAIAHNPQWYKDEQLFNYAMECMYTEENSKFFYPRKNTPISRAINTYFKELCNSYMTTYYSYWNNEYSDKDRFLTPLIQIDANATDEELKELATHLEDYLVSTADIRQLDTTTQPIYVMVEGHDYDFDGKICGFYFTAPDEYVLGLEFYPGEDYADLDKNPQPLLDILKEIRQKYWYTK